MTTVGTQLVYQQTQQHSPGYCLRLHSCFALQSFFAHRQICTFGWPAHSPHLLPLL